MDLSNHLSELSSPSTNVTPKHLSDLNRALQLSNERRELLRQNLKDRPLSFRIIKFNRWGASLKRTISIDASERNSEAIVFDKSSTSNKSSSSDEKRFPLEDISAIVRSSSNDSEILMDFKTKSNRSYKINFMSSQDVLVFCVICKFLESRLVVRYDFEIASSDSSKSSTEFKCQIDGAKMCLDIDRRRHVLNFRTQHKRSLLGSSNSANDKLDLNDDVLLLPVSNDGSSRTLRVVGNHPRAYRTGGQTSWMLTFPSPLIARQFEICFSLAHPSSSTSSSSSSKEKEEKTNKEETIESNLPQYSVFTGSFNVGESSPKDCNLNDLSKWKAGRGLHEWFMPPSEWTATPTHTQSVKAKYYDIVAIGLQECSHKEEWVEALKNYYETIRRAMSLPKQTHEMNVLGTSTQWGITLIVFVRKDLKSRITSLCIDQVAAGGRKIVGVAVANKGAVMISFSLNGSTSLGFVCSHFPARAERLAKRNKAYGTIVDDLRTKPKIRKSEMDRDISSKSQTSVSIFSLDHVFWVGDFNYRVDGGRGGTPEEFNQVVNLSKHMKFQKIVKYDQLLREIRNQRSFVGFREGAISFPPTYRRDRKSSRKFSNKRNQNPSYPDRILWRSLPSCVRRLSQDEYWAAMNLVGSDHRPVAASFSLQSNPDVTKADRVSNRLIRKHNQVIGQRCSVLVSRAMYITLNHSSKFRRYCGNVISGSDISYQWNSGSISGPVPCVVCGRKIKISREQFEIVRGEKRESYKWETLNESTKNKASLLKRFSTGMMSRVMSSRGGGGSMIGLKNASSPSSSSSSPFSLKTSKNDNPYGIVESACPMYMVCSLCRPYAELQDDLHHDDPTHKLTPSHGKQCEDEEDMPIGLDDAQEETDKCVLESRDEALCCSDSGGLRLLFQAPYLSVGTFFDLSSCVHVYKFCVHVPQYTHTKNTHNTHTTHTHTTHTTHTQHRTRGTKAPTTHNLQQTTHHATHNSGG